MAIEPLQAASATATQSRANEPNAGGAASPSKSFRQYLKIGAETGGFRSPTLPSPSTVPTDGRSAVGRSESRLGIEPRFLPTDPSFLPADPIQRLGRGLEDPGPPGPSELPEGGSGRAPGVQPDEEQDDGDVSPSTLLLPLAIQASAHPTAPLVAASGPEQSGSLPALVGDWVSQIAWSAGSRKGALRMEIGRGRLAGTVVTFQEEGGAVAIDIELAAGQSAASWEERLAERLERQGIAVRSLRVR